MTEPMPVIKRPPTTQEAVLAELRRSILSGASPPGSAIRPDAIAAQFAVSRIPIREALRTLEGEGLVIYRPHQGYFVAELRLEDVEEIFRIRELLEEEAIRKAVPNLGSEELAAMSTLVEEMKSLDDGDVLQLTLANRSFHFAMMQPANMPRLQHHIGLLWNASDPYLSLFYTSGEQRRRVHREHACMVRAAARGDVESLVAEWSRHRQHAVEALREILDK